MQSLNFVEIQKVHNNKQNKRKTNKMTVLIFGAGFLGNRLAKEIPNSILLNSDISNQNIISSTLKEYKPTAVINAAGKTGKPNVDWCESHPIETFSSNALGPAILAQACLEQNIYLLHLASGCIFYGPSPSQDGWSEYDFANPSALYSKTKYAADMALSVLPNVGIARLRMPIDHVPGPRNLITKLANYKQVVDVTNSVTIVEDLVHVVNQLVQIKATGIFHVTNPGTMKHKDLLSLYKKHVDPNHSVEYISAEDLTKLNLAQKARSNCILSSNRLKEFNISMRHINLALEDTIIKYSQYSK